MFHINLKVSFRIPGLSQNLNVAFNYILSYWFRSSGFVDVDANSTILDVQYKRGWIYMKRRISGSGSLIISGHGEIDELRLYLPNRPK